MSNQPNQPSYPISALNLPEVQLVNAGPFDPAKRQKNWVRKPQPGEQPEDYLVMGHYGVAGDAQTVAYVKNLVMSVADAAVANIAPPTQAGFDTNSPAYTLPPWPVPQRTKLDNEKIVANALSGPAQWTVQRTDMQQVAPAGGVSSGDAATAEILAIVKDIQQNIVRR